MNIVGTETALSLLYDNIQRANLSADVINDSNVLSNTLFLNDNYALLVKYEANDDNLLMTYYKFNIINNGNNVYCDDMNFNDDDIFSFTIINNSSIYDVQPYGITNKLNTNLYLINNQLSAIDAVINCNTINTIGQNAFSNISIDVFFCPTNILNIEGEAFSESNILSIICDNKLRNISKLAFTNSNVRYIQLKSCNIINDRAFSNCQQLSTIIFPSNLSVIQKIAFYNCTSLPCINLQNTQVEVINEFTFAHCSSLVSASFPSTLLSIDSFAFYDCPKLSAFDFTNANPIKLQEQIFYSCARNYTIFVSDDKYNKWIRLNNQLLFDESNLSSHIKVL